MRIRRAATRYLRVAGTARTTAGDASKAPQSGRSGVPVRRDGLRRQTFISFQRLLTCEKTSMPTSEQSPATANGYQI